MTRKIIYTGHRYISFEDNYVFDEQEKEYNILQMRSLVGSPKAVSLIPYTDLSKTEFKEILM